MTWKAYVEGNFFLLFFSTPRGWVGGSDQGVENSTLSFFIFLNPSLISSGKVKNSPFCMCSTQDEAFKIRKLFLTYFRIA